jgi:hypothetical protein
LLRSFKRGLFALAFFFFCVHPLFANYLYKDEVIHNPKFTSMVNAMGTELYEKTGIALRMVVLKKLDGNETIVDYEKQLAAKLQKPVVLLTFSAENKKVDILARPQSLYQYFNKKQVLSPAAGFLDALYLAVFYSRNWQEFKDTMHNYGGTIIPLLAQRAKEDQILGKYSVALFNGYADIAAQIAKAKKIQLKTGVGNANKETFTVFQVIFYMVLLYAAFLYIRRKIKRREFKNENK